jgi:predicted dehydrogenase
VELHGSEGSLLYGFSDGKLQLKTSRMGEEAAKSWIEREVQANLPTAFKRWVNHIKENTSDDHPIEMAVNLTKLMEAANLSARENRTVLLDSLIQ